MRLTTSELARIIGAAGGSDAFVTAVTIDSRTATPETAFFALKGSRSDGHRFIEAALANGAPIAVASQYEGSDPRVILVQDALQALQQLAAWWRNKWTGRVVAITGSYGKTATKECLAALLPTAYRSPGSFNSQIGVPLSILQAPADAPIYLLEVGISEPGEMACLAEIVRPDCGILTNIGLAHITSFGSQEAILREKLQLFRALPADAWLLAPPNVDGGPLQCRIFRTGSSDVPRIVHRAPSSSGTLLEIEIPNGKRREVTVGTQSLHQLANIEMALSAAFLLTKSDTVLQALEGYRPAATRMETWRSTSGVTVIRSSGPDLLSVQSALDHMSALAGATAKKYFLLDTADQPADFVQQAVARAEGAEVLLDISRVKQSLGPTLKYGDVVVVHAPQKASIDAIASELIGAMAPNRFIIDLQAIQENLLRFRKHLGPDVAILAMVKALAYGTEISHLAAALQGLEIDGFGVSTPDEAIALRKAGVTLPILVMLCTPGEADKMMEHDLTPVIYSFDLLEAIAQAARRAGRLMKVHMEIDTGMGRTGVAAHDALEVAKQIEAAGLRLRGVMTHLASADDPREDEFTRAQLATFAKAVEAIRHAGHADLVLHAANTSAAARLSEARFNMVRIGLGLYGIHPSDAVREALELAPAVALVSQISRVQSYKVGDRIGYGGTYTVNREGFKGAVIPIGYHDGVPWSVANKGRVMIDGQRAAIVGRVSMDSMVVDVTDIPDARQGADVLLFGSYGGYTLPVEEISSAAGTIPYELLARIGPRVQRIFLGL